MTTHTWPEPTPWGSDLIEDAFLNLLETPWDLAGLEIPEDPSIFDSFLWPNDGEDQENMVDLDLSDTEVTCPNTSQSGEQDFAFVDEHLPIENLRGSVPPDPTADHTQTQPGHDQREFNDCLHSFESGLKDVSHRRKRRRFSPGRRKEVDQLRKVGACIRCRLMKSKASVNYMLHFLSDVSSANWTVRVLPASKLVVLQNWAKLSVSDKVCFMFGSHLVRKDPLR